MGLVANRYVMFFMNTVSGFAGSDATIHEGAAMRSASRVGRDRSNPPRVSSAP